MNSARLVAREIRRWVGHPETRSWPPHSRLLLLSDAPHWVLAYEMEEVGGVARRLGITVADAQLHRYARRQCVFYASQFSLFLGKQYRQPNRIATAYLHGRPGTGVPEFDATFEALVRHHDRVDRVQVSHDEMRAVVLSSGIDPSKVHQIRLAVNTTLFARRSPDDRARARAALKIPAAAHVIGSFQKDGVGWSDGATPKLVKGPDVFLDVLDQLRGTVPNLFVLLSGPARGYVRDGLTRMHVPYLHHYPRDPRAMPELYHALDAYLVTSRQEGGPKAVLESMAVGVPLITTRVGQATDIVHHGENGWIADVEDVARLARCTAEALARPADLDRILDAGRRTALDNSYEAQMPLWDSFFDGFVARGAD